MNWEALGDYEALSDRAASILLDAITAHPKLVLGLPTGNTPVGMYGRVVKECKRSYRCFRDVVTFNLDEYVGIARDHPGSYFSFMQQHLFSHVDIDAKNTFIPNGRAPDLKVECERYERLLKNAGGLGLTFLGLGSNGHRRDPPGQRDVFSRPARPDPRDHNGHRHDPGVEAHRAPRQRRKKTGGHRAAPLRGSVRRFPGVRAVEPPGRARARHGLIFSPCAD